MTTSELTINARLHGQDLGFATTYGLFSPKGIDEGTQLLADRLDINNDDDCLDLGCGYGPLGIVMAKLAPVGTTEMIDKDFVAVEYAQKNAIANGAANTRTYLSNGFSAVPKSQMYDVIASNIPAKIGNELLEQFLRDAHDHLNPGGRLYIVTISGLKEYMKRNLNEVFGNYDKLKQSRTYTAAVAIKR